MASAQTATITWGAKRGCPLLSPSSLQLNNTWRHSEPHQTDGAPGARRIEDHVSLEGAAWSFLHLRQLEQDTRAVRFDKKGI